MATLILDNNAGVTFDLSDSSVTGLRLNTVDVTGPAVREVTYDLPAQDDVDDQTKYLGQRVVTISGVAINRPGVSRSKALAQLDPFLDPQARSTLTYQIDDDMDVRTVGIRASQWTAPAYGYGVGGMFTGPDVLGFTYVWKGDAVTLGVTAEEVDIAPFSSTAGRTYPRAYPLQYPSPSGGTGVGTLDTGGTYKTWPTYRIYGPATNPAVAVLDMSGNVVGQLVFSNDGGLNIVDGDYVEVDTKARTALLNGEPGSNQYGFIDFTQSDWAPLAAGQNQVRFTATSATTPALLAVTWKPAYL